MNIKSGLERMNDTFIKGSKEIAWKKDGGFRRHEEHLPVNIKAENYAIYRSLRDEKGYFFLIDVDIEKDVCNTPEYEPEMQTALDIARLIEKFWLKISDVNTKVFTKFSGRKGFHLLQKISKPQMVELTGEDVSKLDLEKFMGEYCKETKNKLCELIVKDLGGDEIKKHLVKYVDNTVYSVNQIFRTISLHDEANLYSVPLNLDLELDEIFKRAKFENISYTPIKIPEFSLMGYLSRKEVEDIKRQSIKHEKPNIETKEWGYSHNPNYNHLEIYQKSPPCIKRLFKKAWQGINMEHGERLSLCIFVHRAVTGDYFSNKPISKYMSDEEVEKHLDFLVKIFERQRDFHDPEKGVTSDLEDTTDCREQVRTLVNKKTAYWMPSCVNMFKGVSRKGENLCYGKDGLCCSLHNKKWRNPLAYYSYKSN